VLGTLERIEPLQLADGVYYSRVLPTIDETFSKRQGRLDDRVTALQTGRSTTEGALPGLVRARRTTARDYRTAWPFLLCMTR